MLAGFGNPQGVNTEDAISPGAFVANVRLGLASGPNVFEIDAGAASAKVAIDGN